MKYFFLILRIVAFCFYTWLFYYGFDLLSCVLGMALVLFTTYAEQKKSEAVTPDF